MIYNKVSDDDLATLKGLNQVVDEAIQNRTEWLDKKMIEYSALKVGDEIFDLRSCQKLGVVSKIYRYWAGRNSEHDTSLSWNYEYETSPRCFDNTSRQIGISFGSREEAKRRAKQRAEFLLKGDGE